MQPAGPHPKVEGANKVGVVERDGDGALPDHAALLYGAGPGVPPLNDLPALPRV